MWSPPHLDEMVDFVADFSGNQSAKMSGTKRSFLELDDDDGGVFGNKKANLKMEETTQGETTKIIVSLRERFEKYKEDVEKLKCAARELKALQSRKLLLDPAIYEEFMRLKNLVDEKEQKMKELQEQIKRLTFTPLRGERGDWISSF